MNGDHQAYSSSRRNAMIRTCLAALALLMLAGPATAQPGKLNVLFLVADDLRADLGCYGSPALSPNIDGLAGRGVLFNRAYCQQAVCNPSRSSFLTGMRPDTLHQWSNGQHFREKNPDVITLPMWFKEHGYVTRNVGKIFHNWHTKEKGDRRSWSADEFLYYETHGKDAAMVEGKPPPNTALPAPREYTDVPLWEARDVPDAAYYDGRIADEAVKVMGQIKDRPFFLAVGFWKPHAPFNAPKKYWDRYEKSKLPTLNPARPKGAPAIAFHDSREILGIPPKNVTFKPEEVEEARHGYMASIAYMDEQVGKVLAALEANKLADNTIVVFFADHGYHLGEHGLWAKTSCFELDARVPLIIAPPKLAAAGKRTDALAELLDLFPTLVELAGLPPAPKREGKSLVPVLKDPGTHVKHFALSQHPRPAYFDRYEKGIPDAMGYSIRTDKVRYTEWRDWETGNVVARELYEHDRDPHELVNRIDSPTEPQPLAEAKELLWKAVPPDVPPSKR
jgi:iduronate 2-sulfatase